MLLAIDIGNSSIKLGIFDRDRLTAKFLIPSKRDYSPAEIAELVGDRLPAPIDAVIVSSVVPEIDAAMTEYVSNHLHVEPRFVATTDDFGLTFGFPIDTVGTDRLVNSFAAAEKYGTPCLVVSFGTATTIDVVNEHREYLGGVIAPGLNVAIKALTLAASKLPEIKLFKPEYLIAKTTESAIQSGIVHGHVAMIEGLLDRITVELNIKAKIIATGGFADLLAPDIEAIDVVDSDLTLEGLQKLFLRSAG